MAEGLEDGYPFLCCTLCVIVEIFTIDHAIQAYMGCFTRWNIGGSRPNNCCETT